MNPNDKLKKTSTLSLESFFEIISEKLEVFFDSGRFAAFALALLTSTVAFLSISFFLPKNFGKIGQIAVEFRVWCFGYNPASGKYDFGYFIPFLGVPLMLGGAIWALWGQNLKSLWRKEKKALFLSIATAVAINGLGVFLLLGFYSPLAVKASSAIFPAEKLRTDYIPPQFILTDHRGKEFSLSQIIGKKIILLTGVYSSCGSACPMIMAQSKEAVAALLPEERELVRVLAITLDPERDDPKRLNEMAKAHGLPYPLYRMLTGPKERVEDILDRFGFVRNRDKDGIIQHNNLFLLIDKNGKIAYRFYLGKQQLQWLIRALKLLIFEKEEEIREFYQIFFHQLAKTKTSIDDGVVRKALELRQKYILQPMDSLHLAGILNKQIKEPSYKKPIYLFLTLDLKILKEGQSKERPKYRIESIVL